MPPKKVDPRFNSMIKRINQLKLELSDEMILQLHKDLQNAYNQVQQELQDELRKLQDDVLLKVQSVRSRIPSCALGMTVEQIKAAGGTLSVDELTGELVIDIPKELMQSNYIMASKIRPPSAKKIHNEVTIRIQNSAIKNKKSRLVADTPSHTMTLRKKITQNFMNSTPIPDSTFAKKRQHTGNITPSHTATLRKKIPKTEPVDQSAMFLRNVPPSTIKKENKENFNHENFAPSNRKLFLTPSRIPKLPATLTKCKDGNPFTNVKLSLVNPKTPSGKNRLFQKQPRIADDDEIVIHCSTAGTPLVIN